jgi:predicted PurR-regulated permease PerM
VTGLSIVGGIYYFGAPGAIYGPLILCAVFVVLSMYPNALRDFQWEKSRWITPTMQRSESVC